MLCFVLRGDGLPPLPFFAFIIILFSPFVNKDDFFRTVNVSSNRHVTELVGAIEMLFILHDKAFSPDIEAHRSY